MAIRYLPRRAAKSTDVFPLVASGKTGPKPKPIVDDCQMYGTTCFKCRGKGHTYNKRAEEALRYKRELRTVKAEEVQVGWVMLCGGFLQKEAWRTVTAVELGGWSVGSTNGVEHKWQKLEISCGENHGLGAYVGCEVQAVPTAERLKEIRAIVLEYQANLTKAGKVRKQKKAA